MRIWLDQVREEPFSWDETESIKPETLERPELLALGPVRWRGGGVFADPGFLLRGGVSYRQTAARVAGARTGALAGRGRFCRSGLPAAGAALLRPDAGLYPVPEAARGGHDRRGRGAGRGGESPQEAPEAAAGLGGGRERALGGRPRHGGRRGRGPRHRADRPRAAAAQHPDEAAVPRGLPRPLPGLRGRSERARRPVLLRRAGTGSQVGGAGFAQG